MRLFELFDNLLEYDHQITLTKQGPQLVDAYKRQELSRLMAPKAEVESSEILTRLEQMDPTANKMYMLWIVRQYMNSKMSLEDYPQVFGGLEVFHKAKPRLPVEQRDINRFDLHQLYELVDSFSDTQDTANTDTKLNRPDVEVIYNGPLGTIAIPKTEEASCELGSGTQWCTAGKTNNVFINYANAPLIIFQEPGGAKYQFEGPPKAGQLTKFSDGFEGFLSDGTSPLGSWSWPPSRFPKEHWVADARDRYLQDSEIEELYAKNPVLQKYLPLPDKAPDAKVHQEEFKQWIKKYWLEHLRSDEMADPAEFTWTYERYFGPYELERDKNFEKKALYGTGSDRMENHLNLLSTSDSSHSSSMLYHIGEELLGLGWYMEATGMKRWPELEKEIIKALKIWHSKNPVELAGAYRFGFEWESEGRYEELSKMPDVINYLKSIGLSKAA
jgi:hypothetical protein